MTSIIQKCHLHIFYNKPVEIYQDIVLTTFSIRQALASVGPNGELIATPSICLYKISLKIKYDFLVAKDNNSLNTDLFKTSILSF